MSLSSVREPDNSHNMKPILFICLQLCLSFPVMSQTSFTDVLRLPYEAPTQTISYGDSEFQFAEYWHPGSEKPAMVILIHGGCWLNAYGLDHVRALASRLRSNNYAVWSVEYRRLGDEGGGWPGSFSDILDATDAVLNLSNIDFDNVFVVGHSAGGHLALWLGAAAGFDKESPFYDKLKLPIKGVIGLAAISNLVDYAGGSSGCERATRRLMGGKPEAQLQRYRYASPHLLRSAANTVLVHGGEDTIVNIRQSQQFAEVSANVELISLPGLGHFDLVNPDTETFEQIILGLKRLASISPALSVSRSPDQIQRGKP